MFDRAALRQLFDYTTFTWESYGRTLPSLPSDAFARQVPGSGWPALRNALFHIAAAWDGWLVERLALDALADIKPEDIAGWAELNEMRQRNRGWLRRIIDETPEPELMSADRPMWSGTPAEFRTSVADVVAHILLHERGHHGDVSTLIAQLGGTPPNMDYLVYSFFKQRQER